MTTWKRTLSVVGGMWVAGVLLVSSFAPAVEPPAGSLMLILDASGSMWGQIEGEHKIVIARRVLRELLTGLDDRTEVGVIAYGHRREGDCDDIETVVPLAPLDRAAVVTRVDALNPKGKTPITRSVEAAFDLLRQRPEEATLILVSDGLETCGGDLCATVRDARAEGIGFVLHVVGFDVSGEDVSSLECAAQAGQGLFRTADSASELAGALEQAVALTADLPAGRLSVEVVADGALQDAAVHATGADGEEAGGGRTYSSPDTNPRSIPLADGRYSVVVEAVGIRGDRTRSFEVEILEGSTETREVDFSTGQVQIRVTRNDQLGDAVYKIRLPGTGAEIASGRTYTSEGSNPARERVVAGTYEIAVGSVEISGDPRAELGRVTIAAGGSIELSHDFSSGTLRVGSARDGALVDSVVRVLEATSGRAIAQGRTYTRPSTNPRTFELEPGRYLVSVQEIRGEVRDQEVTIERGKTVELMVDPGHDG